MNRRRSETIAVRVGITFFCAVAAFLAVRWMVIAATRTVATGVATEATYYMNQRRIVKDSSGNLYVAGVAPISSVDEVAILRSTDGGTTWTTFRAVSAFGDSIPDRHTALAIDARDNLYAVWEHRVTASDIDLQARVYDKTTDTWGSVTTISNTSDAEQTAAIAVDANNVIHIAWSGTDSNTAVLRYLNFTPGTISYNGSLGSATSPDNTETGVAYPSLDVDANGVVHIAYRATATQRKIYYRQRSASGTWSSAEQISATSSNDADVPLLFIRDAGHPNVIYIKDINLSSSRVLAASGRSSAGASGQWSTPASLATDDAFDAGSASAGIDSNNNVFVLYIRGSGKDLYKRVFNSSTQQFESEVLLESTNTYAGVSMRDSRYPASNTLSTFADYLLTETVDSSSSVVYGTVSTNFVPTVTSGVISNRDDTDNVYANYRYYEFQAVVNDPNGTSDLDEVDVRFGNSNITNGRIRIHSEDGVLSIAEGSSVASLQTTTPTTSTSGNALTLTFGLKVDWDYPDADDLELEVRVSDRQGGDSGYSTVQTDYFDIITDIEIDPADWYLADSTLNPSDTGTLGYRIEYEGSEIMPTDNSVNVAVTAVSSGSTGGVGGDGAQISEATPIPTRPHQFTGTGTFTAPSTVGSTALSPKVTLSKSDGSLNETFTLTSTSLTLVTDRVAVIKFSAENQDYTDSNGVLWKNHDGTSDAFQLSFTAGLERTQQALSGGQLIVGYTGDDDAYGGATMTNGIKIVSIEETPSDGQVIKRVGVRVTSATEGGNNVYGDAVNMTVASLTWGWDDAPPTNYQSDAPDVVTSGTSLTMTISGATDDGSGVDRTFAVFSSDANATPTIEQSSLTVDLSALSDGDYTLSYDVTDHVGNVGTTARDTVAVDFETTAPDKVTSGFFPQEDAIIHTRTPTLSWNAPDDPDPSESPDDLIYQVRLDSDGEIVKSHKYEYTTTERGKTSQAVITALKDKTEWVYAVRARDPREAWGAWSDPVSFWVNTELGPNIVATKTVGIDVKTKAATVIPTTPMSLVRGLVSENTEARSEETVPALPTVEAGGVRVLVRDFKLVALVLGIVREPIVTYLIFVLFVFSVGYAFGALTQKEPLTWMRVRRSAAGLFRFMVQRPTTSFRSVSPRDASGTWVYPFSRYEKHHRISRVTALSAILLAALKLTVVSGLTWYLVEVAPIVVGSSPLHDDSRNIAPGQTAMYRIDYENLGGGDAHTVVFTDPLPRGVSYVAGTLSWNGVPQTDAEDVRDNARVEKGSVVINVGDVLAAQSGSFTFQARVSNPSSLERISNTASFTYFEEEQHRITNSVTNALITGSIGDLVWEDENNDGLKGENEAGREGIVLRLYQDADGDLTYSAKDLHLATATTDAQGQYAFKQLGVGVYFIDIDQTTFPSDLTLSTGFDGWRVSLSRAGELITTFSHLDFGLRRPAGAAPITTPEPTPESPEEQESKAEEPSVVSPQEIPKLLERFVLVKQEESAIIAPSDLEIPEADQPLFTDFALVTPVAREHVPAQSPVLVFEGQTQPFYFIQLYIYSKPLIFSDQADEKGYWRIEVQKDRLVGEDHVVFVSVTDPEGRTSSQVEIARISVIKEGIEVNTFYLMLLGGILVSMLIVIFVYHRGSARRMSNIEQF
jgi:uncharacterized repeat protein (TIGR01451 family)